MEVHYETKPQTNLVIGSPRAGETVFSKFVWSTSLIHSFFRMIVILKGSCLELRAYAVRLEAPEGLRLNLKGWKASCLKVSMRL